MCAVVATPPKPKTLKRQLYDFMQPGRWYTRGELGRALGWPRGSLRATLRRVVECGAVQMTIDPEGDPQAWLKGRGGHRWAFRRVEGYRPADKPFRRTGWRNGKKVRW